MANKSGMEYVTHNSTLKCKNGSKEGILVLTKGHGTTLYNAVATDRDTNVTPFGICSFLKRACTPNTASKWTKTKMDFRVGHDPVITMDSLLTCSHCGTISVVKSAQRIKKESDPITTIDEMRERFAEMKFPGFADRKFTEGKIDSLTAAAVIFLQYKTNKPVTSLGGKKKNIEIVSVSIIGFPNDSIYEKVKYYYDWGIEFRDICAMPNQAIWIPDQTAKDYPGSTKDFNNGALSADGIHLVKVPYGGKAVDSKSMTDAAEFQAVFWANMIFQAEATKYLDLNNLMYMGGKSAYRIIGKQTAGGNSATPGKSQHGWGTANDFSLLGNAEDKKWGGLVSGWNGPRVKTELLDRVKKGEKLLESGIDFLAAIKKKSEQMYWLLYESIYNDSFNFLPHTNKLSESWHWGLKPEALLTDLKWQY